MGGTATAQIASGGTSASSGLVYGASATAPGTKALSRATLRGKVSITLPAGVAGVTRVAYYLNDPIGKGEPAAVATQAPFAISPNGMDTTKMRNGRHTLLAIVTTASGSTDMFARFIVKNAGGSATGAGAGTQPTRAGNTGTGTAASGAARPTRPAAAKVKVGTREVWKGDFETGDLGQWGNCQAEGVNGECGKSAGDRVTVVNDARQGKYAAKFTLKPGDSQAGGERAEVAEGDAPGPGSKEGDEYWFEWSTKFDQGFKNPTVGWFIILQWHSASGSPPVAVEVDDEGNIIVTKDGSNKETAKKLGTVRPGQWTDFVLHIKFSNSDSGFIEGWENGKLTLPKWNRSTMRSESNYLKHGIYRGKGSSDTAVVTHDGMRITAP